MATYIDKRSSPEVESNSSSFVPQLLQFFQERGQIKKWHPQSAAGANPARQEVVLQFEYNGRRYTLLRQREPERRELESPMITLSPREQEIVRLVASGRPNKTIAKILEISPWTVNTHIRRVFIKMNVNSRTEMVACAIKQGLIR